MTYTTEADIEAMAEAICRADTVNYDHVPEEEWRAKCKAMSWEYKHHAEAALAASSVHAELARVKAMYAAVRQHAIAQDCCRICDAGGIPYAEQWIRSKKYVDGLAKQALQQKGGR